MEEPESGTIDSAAAGDLEAFASLVRATQEHVWRFIRHLVGDDDTAADLTQETFVRVHRSLHTFRHDAAFATWLLRIARNLVVDEHRREMRRPRTRPADDALALVDPTLGPGAHSELRAALAALPEPQREAILLVEIAGLRYREAAEVLGVAEGTVKSRVFNGRAALVRWMEADEAREVRHG